MWNGEFRSVIFAVVVFSFEIVHLCKSVSKESVVSIDGVTFAADIVAERGGTLAKVNDFVFGIREVEAYTIVYFTDAVTPLEEYFPTFVLNFTDVFVR